MSAASKHRIVEIADDFLHFALSMYDKANLTHWERMLEYFYKKSIGRCASVLLSWLRLRDQKLSRLAQDGGTVRGSPATSSLQKTVSEGFLFTVTEIWLQEFGRAKANAPAGWLPKIVLSHDDIKYEEIRLVNICFMCWKDECFMCFMVFRFFWHFCFCTF